MPADAMFGISSLSGTPDAVGIAHMDTGLSGLEPSSFLLLSFPFSPHV